MVYDLILVGFGVISTEVLSELYNKKINSNFKIAIVDKDLSNFPGGIAYSKSKSKYGYFNNPLRLSNDEFKDWISKDKNLNILKNFILKNKEYELNDWLRINEKFLKNKKLEEVYFPRLVYSFFLEDKIKKNIIGKNKKIKLQIFKGKIIDIKKENNFIIESKYNLDSCLFVKKKNELSLEKINKNNSKIIEGKKVVIGTGIVAPSQNNFINVNNKNYIGDFYADGGTSYLIKKLKKVKKSKITIIFIGNKAGLLECMQKLQVIINSKKKDINLISISPNLLSLEKAILSKNYNNLKLKYFSSNNLKKIYKAKDIYKLLIKEFKIANKRGFKKYDAWTKILKFNLLNYAYKNLNKREQFNYNQKILNKIRNITRFTYPETVNAKESLIQNKKLNLVKGRINSIISRKNSMIVVISSKKKVIGDIVVNVSGPRPITAREKRPNFIDSIKKFCTNYNEKGFYAKKDFMIGKNIFSPGTLTINFNPMRQTIIKAITSNSKKVANKIYSQIKD